MYVFERENKGERIGKKIYKIKVCACLSERERGRGGDSNRRKGIKKKKKITHDPVESGW